MESPSARAYVYIIENMETGKKEDISRVAQILQKCCAVTVLVIDTVLDTGFLDCMISADICIATEYGKWNSGSKDVSKSLYEEEQILFLMGKKKGQKIQLNDLSKADGLIHFVTKRENLRDTVSKYVSSLLFAKGEKQIHCLKQYFNLYKTSLWRKKEQISEAESRCFCFLARNREEAEEADGI